MRKDGKILFSLNSVTATVNELKIFAGLDLLTISRHYDVGLYVDII